MDLSRVLQARDLIIFWVAVGAISGCVVAGAVLIVPGQGPHRVAEAAVIACDSGLDEVLIMDASAGSTVIDGCRESPDNWNPPY